MKLLIVDDEPLVRRSLERAFGGRGFEIISAEDGEAGLRLWLEHTPELVLLDVLMPGLTGPQVIAQVPEAIRMRSFVVAMSAFSGTQKEFDSESAPQVNMFLSKPFEDIFSLVDRIEKKFKNRV